MFAGMHTVSKAIIGEVGPCDHGAVGHVNIDTDVLPIIINLRQLQSVCELCEAANMKSVAPRLCQQCFEVASLW